MMMMMKGEDDKLVFCRVLLFSKSVKSFNQGVYRRKERERERERRKLLRA